MLTATDEGYRDTKKRPVVVGRGSTIDKKKGAFYFSKEFHLKNFNTSCLDGDPDFSNLHVYIIQSYKEWKGEGYENGSC